jgi:hypothetical protein
MFLVFIGLADFSREVLFVDAMPLSYCSGLLFFDCEVIDKLLDGVGASETARVGLEEP